METEDIFEKRRKQLGLSSSGPKQDSSLDDAFTRRRMDLGLIPDTRPKATPQMPKTQAQSHSFGNDATNQFQGKLPSASLLTVGTGGPSHASQITGNTRFDQNRREIEDSKAPAIVKSYANVMNNLVEGNPVGRFLSRALPSDPTVQQDSTGNKTADKVAGFLKQNVTPILTPTGAPIGQGIIGGSYDAAGKALSKGIGQKAVNAAANLIPKASASTAQNIARVGLTEGIAGAAQGVGLGLQNGQDSGKQILANAGLGAAGGLVLGAGGAALGETPFLRNLFEKNGIPDHEINDLVGGTLSLPEGRGTARQAEALKRSNLSPNTEPVANPYTFDLPEASQSLRSQKENAASGRAGVNEMDSALHELNTSYEQAVIDEYKVLKSHRDNPQGVDQGELYFDADGNVTGRRGRLSNNPLWYQNAMKENGYQRLSNKQLYELARKHVDEGMDTEAGRVPSWKEQNGYDEQIQALQQARETLNQSVREIDPPINVVDSPLVESRLAKPGAKPTTPYQEPVIRDPRQTSREQEIYNKVVNGGQPTQDEIDFMLSDQFNPDNIMPETVPTESTYKKPGRLNARPEPTPETPVRTNINPEVKTTIQETEEVVQAANHPKIRDKVYNYLDEAEKAARERIAKRRGYLNSNPLPEWGDYAVIMAAKLGKGTIKAANFTEELVREFGEAVRPHADRILLMAREEIRRQERVASKEGRAAEEFNNQATGNADTFAQKISRVKPKKSKSFAERWQNWRTQFTDDLAALDVTERKLNGGKLLDAKDSLYKAGRLFKGAPQKADQIVQDRLSPVVNMVEKSGRSVEDLEMYALAKHARDVNAAGYKSGFTNQEIDSVLRKLDSPQMQTAHKELIQVNRDMLQELVDSGVVSKDLQDVLNERWKNYIPLFRELESDKVNFQGGVSKALANVTSPIKALQGSDKQVIAPMENMVKNIFQTVNAAERNRVAQQIPKLAKLDTEQQFFRKMESTEDVGQKNVLKVKVGGQEVRYEVNPEVYKAIMNLDQESSNTLINILSKPASILRAGATLTPEFALRNPIRDVINAFVVSKSGFNPITDFGVGLIQSIKKGDLYKDWVNNLGAYGNTLSMDRKVHQQALETVLKQPASKKFVNVVTGKTLVRILRAVSDTTESATKIGEYRAALRQGVSKQEAAYRSRDLMDFARAGSSIRPTNRVVAFLNANIQGKSKLIRAIQDDWKGVAVRGTVAVTLPTVGIYMLNHTYGSDTQKETIRNAPDWMKDSFWLMAIPGTDTVARIPKPFDLAAVFANLPEKALQYTQDNDPEAFDGFVKRTLKENSLPTQISGLLPMIEGMANYSFFKEGQIIPKAEQNLQWSDQFDPVRTSSTARLLAAGAEKITGGEGSFKNFSSPRIMDNTLQGLTAGLGKYATDAIDAILDGTGVYKRTEKPAKSLEQAPFTRSFLVDPNQGGKAMDQFYTMKDELTKDKASSKLNGKLFSADEKLKKADTLEDMMKDIAKKQRKLDRTFGKLEGKSYSKQDQLDTINDVSDTMSTINKAIKEIEKGPLSSAEKKRQIDPLIQQRNDLAKRSTDFFKVRK